MAIVNLNWYNLQSLRRYPLVDSCTGETDDGRSLPNDIIVDCRIQFPDPKEQLIVRTPFLEAVTVSPGLVTAVISIDEHDVQLDQHKQYSIAAVSVIKPVSVGVHYAVTPLIDGVAGWMVFGAGIDSLFSGRFSRPAQTKLQERCVRGYRPLPIKGIKIAGSSTVLSGVVRLNVDAPLKATTKKISVKHDDELVAYNAIFIGLDEQLLTDEYNPFNFFLHKCAGRPESGTCPKPGIQTINGLSPDCYGNLDIVFETLNSLPFPGGLAITTDYGIADACQENKKLPQFYSDKCCPRRFDTLEERDSIPATEFSVGDIVRIGVPPVTDANPYSYYRVTVIDVIPGEEPGSPPTYAVTWEEIFTTDPDLESILKHCDWPDPTTLVPDVTIDLRMPEYPEIDLPLCLDFCFCSGKSPLLREVSGTFITQKIKAPFGCVPCNEEPTPTITVDTSQKLTEHNVLFSDNSATVSLALLKASQSDWSIGRTISAKLKIAPTGLNRDGGLAINYRAASVNGTTQIKYYAAVIDVSRGALRLLSYSNNSITVLAQVPFSATTDAWYKISATPIITNNAVAFNLNVVQHDDPTNTASINNFLVALSDYEPLTGTFGLYANRSNTYFNDLQIT